MNTTDTTDTRSAAQPDVTAAPETPSRNTPEYAAKFWTTVSSADGMPVTLPSGVRVLMRQYPLHEMLLRGRLPKKLQAVALHVYNDGAVAADAAAAAENIAFIDAVIVHCLIAPKACDGQSPAPADAVSVHDIPLRDRLRMFAWAMGDVRASSQDFAPFLTAPTP